MKPWNLQMYIIGIGLCVMCDSFDCPNPKVSRGGFDDPPAILPTSAMPDSDDDDDITLQDLVALETMEDDADDDVEADQFFTLSSNTNPLEPFMNSIIHNSGAADDAGGFLRCEQCGQHFVSSIEFRRHKVCCIR